MARRPTSSRRRRARHERSHSRADPRSHGAAQTCSRAAPARRPPCRRRPDGCRARRAATIRWRRSPVRGRLGSPTTHAQQLSPRRATPEARPRRRATRDSAREPAPPGVGCRPIAPQATPAEATRAKRPGWPARPPHARWASWAPSPPASIRLRRRRSKVMETTSWSCSFAPGRRLRRALLRLGNGVDRPAELNGDDDVESEQHHARRAVNSVADPHMDHL